MAHCLWRLALTAHEEAASVWPLQGFLRVCTLRVALGAELSVRPWSPLDPVGHGPFPLTFVMFCILEIVFQGCVLWPESDWKVSSLFGSDFIIMLTSVLWAMIGKIFFVPQASETVYSWGT